MEKIKKAIATCNAPINDFMNRVSNNQASGINHAIQISIKPKKAKKNAIYFVDFRKKLAIMA
ncbi:hypothetical protein [Vibrio metschnikovii]|uniref:hypothetical protein n=1 Tax=Vibrio metschnikovii TaxID=28172 RepID=UPI0011C04048|nr:hypothetical protein [Vibrio metschnikovii]